MMEAGVKVLPGIVPGFNHFSSNSSNGYNVWVLLEVFYHAIKANHTLKYGDSLWYQKGKCLNRTSSKAILTTKGFIAYDFLGQR